MSLWHHDPKDQKLVVSSNPWQMVMVIVALVIIGVVSLCFHGVGK